MSESDAQLSAAEDDVDDIIREHENDGDNNDNDAVVEQQQQGEDVSMEEVKDEENDDNAADDTAKKVDPKKRSTRKLVVLNTERLKGRKGVHTIEKLFEDFKFHGKGHEKDDLDRVMKRLEYWAFRLFPKLEFDDFLAKCESLGHKKDLQNHLKKYRQGMIDPNYDPVVEDANNMQDDIIEDDDGDLDVDVTAAAAAAAAAAEAEREEHERILSNNFDRMLAETENRTMEPQEQQT